MCKMREFADNKYVADIKYDYIKNIALQAETCKNINRIMLFGSAMEERCTDRSDIDIAVFGNETKSRYLRSKEFRDFQSRLFRFGFEQNYDILYFQEGKTSGDSILEDISKGIEIYRRIAS